MERISFYIYLLQTIHSTLNRRRDPHWLTRLSDPLERLREPLEAESTQLSTMLKAEGYKAIGVEKKAHPRNERRYWESRLILGRGYVQIGSCLRDTYMHATC